VAAIAGVALSPDYSDRLAAIDRQAVGHQVYRTSFRLFERLSEMRPIVLAFEDWHWADGSSAELLEHLLMLATSVPVLFVVAYRPEPPGPVDGLLRRLGTDDAVGLSVTQIRLKPLARDAAHALLLGFMGGGSLPSHLNERLLRQADGNPFYLGELFRSLLATGSIARDPDSGDWVATERFQLEALPQSIEGVILARIDRLDDEAKQVVRTASVVGRNFFYRVLRTLIGDSSELDLSLARLKGVQLIEDKRHEPELELGFSHPLIQEAAYSSVLLAQRRATHQRIAKCIEALIADRLENFYSELAYHYAQADDWDKAQYFLLAAGDQAVSIAADAEALEHYERALARTTTSDCGFNRPTQQLC
jgi:predicted ATPase